jgi:DNA-binding transcriptional regulator YbjK
MPQRVPERRERGQQKRDAILEATLRVIAEGGIAAVTHRAVAEVAGVPLAATTYYFASKDDLLEQALTKVAVTEIERIDKLMRDTDLEGFSVKGFVKVFSVGAYEMETPDRMSIMAQYDLFLEAARRPRLRQVAGRWTEAYVRLAEATLRNAGSSDPHDDARLLIAILDGLFVQQLAAPTKNFARSVIQPFLRRFAELVVPSPTK